jgi:hypothetical protein
MLVKVTDTIPLPSKFKKAWKGRRVFLQAGRDTISISKVRQADVKSIREKLKEVGTKIATKDIARAIKSARS